MNVFEDLVVELKEENLLEETVIDRSGKSTNGHGKGVGHQEPNSPDGFEDSVDFDFDMSSFEDDKTANNSPNSFQPKQTPETIRRRLSEMMQALQFVEYVLTAVEANFTGASNAPFDDLSIKKAFHVFEQACSDSDSDGYFEAESALRTRLESWETALAERDRLIPVVAVREYTETANPPLSPQTLFSLIRFYRGIEFSETTRAKFDFLTTRLFSKFVDGERRDLLCPRGEIVRHLNQRYSDWSGGLYKRTDSNDPNTALLVLSLDDFLAEAASASDLGEMVAKKLFERIIELKESAGEMFMVPEVSSAAIECNIAVANRVIEVVSLEVQRKTGSAVRSRYSGIQKAVLFDAVGRTLDIDSFFKNESGEIQPENKPASVKTVANSKEKPTVKPKFVKKVSKGRPTLFGVNRWLLLATALTVVASLGVYSWSEYFATADEVGISTVKTIDLEKPELKQYFKMPSRVSGSMLYAIVSSDYEKLDAAAQREYLQKLLQAGSSKGYNKVSLVNIKGKDVGFASAERIETANK